MSSSLDIQTPYTLHTDEPIQDVYASPWSWFDRTILYFPMYSSIKPDGTDRNKYCSLIVLTLISMIYATFPIIIIIQTQMLSLNLSIYSINNLFLFLVRSISRIIGVYFFYFQFNYPWHSSILQQSNASNYNQNLFWSSLSIIFFILQIGLDVMCSYINLLSKSPLECVLQIAEILMIGWPTRITFFVHFALCLKYKHYLKQLRLITTTTTRGDNIGIIDIMTMYKRIYREFCSEYTAMFEACVKLYLLGILMWIWIDSYAVFATESNDTSEWNNIWLLAVDTVWGLMLMAWYCIPAIIMSEQFVEFERAIWEYSESQQSECSYFLQAIQREPIALFAGNILMTRKHVALVVLSFCAVRYVSFCVQYFE